MELYLIFIAPVLQIVLSVLRGTGKIKMPLGVIAVLAIIAGGILSAEGANLVMDNIMANDPNGRIHCGTPAAMFFLGGTFIDLIASILIGAISIIIYYQAIKSKKATSPT